MIIHLRRRYNYLECRRRSYVYDPLPMRHHTKHKLLLFFFFVNFNFFLFYATAAILHSIQRAAMLNSHHHHRHFARTPQLLNSFGSFFRFVFRFLVSLEIQKHIIHLNVLLFICFYSVVQPRFFSFPVDFLLFFLFCSSVRFVFTPEHAVVRCQETRRFYTFAHTQNNHFLCMHTVHGRSR